MYQYLCACFEQDETSGSFQPKRVVARWRRRADATEGGSYGAVSRQACLDGEDNAVNGMRPHAVVVVEESGAVKPDIPAAQEVVIDEGVVTRVESVHTTTSGLLGAIDVAPIKKLAAEANADETPLLVRLGETETLAVRDLHNQSIPGGWAHVQTVDIMARPHFGSQPSASARRRSTVNASIQSKACSGSPCGIANTKKASPETCPHTDIVGLGVLDHNDTSKPNDLEGGGDSEDFVGVEIGTGRAK